MRGEESGTRAGQALTIIAQNIDQAAACDGPICQDTGMPTFDVKVPLGTNQIWLRRQIQQAVAEATRRGSCAELRRFHHRETRATTSGRNPDHPLRSMEAHDIESS